MENRFKHWIQKNNNNNNNKSFYTRFTQGTNTFYSEKSLAALNNIN